jgi:hypothetical protein
MNNNKKENIRKDVNIMFKSLKVMLGTLLFVYIALLSEIKCMENKLDTLEPETVNRTTSAIQSVCNAINFVTDNPKKALIVGFCLSSQFIIANAENAALYNCHCTLDNGFENIFHSYCPTGQSLNVTACSAFCDAFNQYMNHGCI